MWYRLFLKEVSKAYRIGFLEKK